MRAIVLFINGARQGLHEPTGLEELFDIAWNRAGGARDVMVFPPLQWHADWHAVAAFLQRHMVTAGPSRTRLMITAYSFGAGHGFQRLSKFCRSRGVDIDLGVLVDPVWRFPAPTWWKLSILSMTQLGRLRIQPSVKRMRYFRQFQNRPSGRACVAINPHVTDVEPAMELMSRHQLADDDPEVREVFVTELDKLLSEVSK